jgi:two-component system, OmpR family, response regulator
MRVLVVEDSPKMGMLLEKGLSRAGYAVDLARDGTDAVWMATGHPYDAIVLDIILDGAPVPTDGFEVCRSLRASGCTTPVLMVTARDAVEDRIRGLDVGADDYLPKPFAFDELLARIRAITRRGPIERPLVLQEGDLSLDPAAHVVRRGTQEVDLTPTEFSVLECLMRNQGRALSRGDLVEQVWDFAFDGDPRIVNVYVQSLRDKIDRPFGRDTIRTVRGVGYRVGDPDEG